MRKNKVIIFHAALSVGGRIKYFFIEGYQPSHQYHGMRENIKNATLEELLETPSIDKKAAQSIVDYFTTKEK